MLENKFVADNKYPKDAAAMRNMTQRISDH